VLVRLSRTGNTPIRAGSICTSFGPPIRAIAQDQRRSSSRQRHCISQPRFANERPDHPCRTRSRCAPSTPHRSDKGSPPIPMDLAPYGAHPFRRTVVRPMSRTLCVAVHSLHHRQADQAIWASPSEFGEPSNPSKDFVDSAPAPRYRGLRVAQAIRAERP